MPKFKKKNSILLNIEKQIVPFKSTAEEVSFEWSHHRISSTDSKVRTTLHVSITDSGNERDEVGNVGSCCSISQTLGSLLKTFYYTKLHNTYDVRIQVRVCRQEFRVFLGVAEGIAG